VGSVVATLFIALFGQAWAADWSASLTAPFTEETAKAPRPPRHLGLAPRLVRTAYDAFIIGMVVHRLWDDAAAIATSGGPDTEPAGRARAEVVRVRAL
jgi:hypothetical protein